VKKKILFVCKRLNNGYGISTGLLNSAKFVAEALGKNGVLAEVVEAVDGNDIDRLVTAAEPSIVIIEAIWVTPAKLRELLGIRRHRNVTWIVRVHSKMPFLAEEGNAIAWLREYLTIGPLRVAANSLDLLNDIRDTIGPCLYLPNIYELPASFDASLDIQNHTVDVGCFGAIRPLKNQLKQAVAAIEFGNQNDLTVRFHINAGRAEQRGEQVLKNLRALFGGSAHELVEHPWLDHAAFVELARSMDVGMQVSLSESFNIVTADMVGVGVPVVGSRDIDWLPASTVVANPNSTYEIRRLLETTISGDRAEFVQLQRQGLAGHNRSALRTWLKFVSGG